MHTNWLKSPGHRTSHVLRGTHCFAVGEDATGVALNANDDTHSLLVQHHQIVQFILAKPAQVHRGCGHRWQVLLLFRLCHYETKYSTLHSGNWDWPEAQVVQSQERARHHLYKKRFSCASTARPLLGRHLCVQSLLTCPAHC